MFETLTNRLQNVFDSLGQRGRLSEADVEAAFRELRVALLEADVHFKVVKTLLGRVKTRAVGIEISKALNPGQQIVKILHEELLQTLGNAERLNLSGQPPRVILLVGLQGAGKTTLAGKLALRLKKQGNKPLLVAADPYRPAAAEQLKNARSQRRCARFSWPRSTATIGRQRGQIRGIDWARCGDCRHGRSLAD
jgi:signal recognition particle subunit SRP54